MQCTILQSLVKRSAKMSRERQVTDIIEERVPQSIAELIPWWTDDPTANKYVKQQLDDDRDGRVWDLYLGTDKLEYIRRLLYRARWRQEADRLAQAARNVRENGGTQCQR